MSSEFRSVLLHLLDPSLRLVYLSVPFFHFISSSYFPGFEYLVEMTGWRRSIDKGERKSRDCSARKGIEQEMK